jgi:transposase-like protein
MEFPITELLDEQRSTEWIMEHFHPDGLKCPGCSRSTEQAREYRATGRSRLTTYRCQICDAPYNLYTGTVFQQRHLRPQQVVLLMRGICKGESSKMLAQELKLNYKTVLGLRHQIQANAEQQQPNTPLPDQETETDEMFQNAGGKR